MKEHENIAHALLLLEQATAIIDTAGLREIAAHTDYAKQLREQTILMTPLVEGVPRTPSNRSKSQEFPA